MIACLRHRLSGRHRQHPTGSELSLHLLPLALLLTALAWGRDTVVSADPDWMVDRWTQVDGLPVDHVEDVALDADGYLWIAGSDGLSELAGGHVRTWRRDELPWLRGNRLTEVRATPDGALLVTDPAGPVYRVLPATRPLQGEQVEAGGGEARPGQGPVAVEQGVGWRVQDGALWRGETRLAPIQGTAHRLLQDGAGGLWVATDGGLLHVRRAVARTLDALPGRESVSVDLVRSDGQSLWIGAVSGELARIAEDRLVAAPATPPTLAGSALATLLLRPLGDGTMSLFERNHRRVLHPDGTLARVDDAPWPPDSGPWLRFDGADYVITRDALWVVAPGGARTELRSRQGPIRRARDLVALPGGQVLVVTGEGLLFGPPDALRAREAALPSRDVRGALLDGDTLWLGTEDAGLCRLRPVSDPLRAPISCVSEAEGLGEHTVHNIQADRRGRLWLGTNRGVLVVPRDALHRALDGDEEALAPLRLDARDGLRNPETNGGQWSVEQTADGRLWFPTMGGPAVLDPDLLPKPAAISVRIEAIRVNDQERCSAGPLALRSDERDLTVRWSVPEYVRPEQVRVRYRLEGEGEGEDWHIGTGIVEATWHNLPPGDQALVIEASLGGAWGPARRLAVKRAPTFLESWAFPVALILGSVALTAATARGLGHRRRLRERALEATVAQRTAQLAERNAAVLVQAAHLKQVALRLAEVDVARTRFVANLSHELRTPLMLVMGSLEEIGRDVPEDRLAQAWRNVERLRELIDQLFDLVRLEAGRLPMRARRIDLGPWLKDLVQRHAPLAAARQVRLDLSRCEAPVALWADPDLLEKIVGNLLSNGLKFTSGSLSVRLEADDHEARLRVSDDGQGVPPALSERIFERFYQISSGDDRKAEGAGVGLSLARELAELHGGTLRLVPQDGPGATFELTLPMGTLHLSAGDISLEARSGPVVPPRPPDASRGAARVLIAEDHLELRAWLTARLGESYPVETVADGAEALARLGEGGFGLLLSDLMMPGMDGLTLCRAVRDDPALASLPIVLLSARGVGASAEAYAAGATSYLGKPILTSELMSTLHSLLPPAVAASAEPPSPVEPAPEEGAPLQPASPHLTPVERDLLERIEEIAHADLCDTDFSVEVLAQRVGMSPRTLHRKLVHLTGKAPVYWLQELRLAQARERLREGRSVSEVAYAVGMAPNYFSRVFRAWYGHPPSEERSPWAGGGRRPEGLCSCRPRPCPYARSTRGLNPTH